ncbi:hypothetical protein M406DRAFT_251808 [Cryphonectria parasitica EP155]|uniref:Glutamine amidotransferase type-2 domain-containing protein n=1 Tax=Cryphonectria parasitica (strain ATCC 38755 / EP155) TaxID=660469 RepID=A0A9P5CQA2_CRYP1|nr:uncharacterized protein M406DRAFT_251808 [Cryphonectria parasitica EP155]KAF3767013.1 hypothetical protein M406DRAFT_251808 [Cryphonectria parasitica EP155]
MCGIHAVISASKPIGIPANLQRCLCNRGPDHIATHETQLGSKADADAPTTRYLSFTSTVLALRGDHVARQPFVDPSSGSVLCWNGEAWRFRHHDVAGNDGEAIAGLLAGAVRRGETEREEAILKVLRSIDGPFAFVFFDKASKKLYFGRDRLGRRSLLFRRDGHQLVLSSVADSVDPQWKEVEADGIYVLDLGTDGFGGQACEFVSAIGRFNDSVPSKEAPLTVDSTSVTALRQHLTESLRLRVLNVFEPPGTESQQTPTKVAVLFSGGLDSTMIARMCHDLLPSDQGIDLINVAFENPRVAANAKKSMDQKSAESLDVYEACPDRGTGRKSFAEVQAVCPGRAWRLIAVSFPLVTSLIYPHNTEMDLSIACALYFAARGQGVAFTDATSTSSTPYTTTARVLLSGLGADELFGGYSRHAVAFLKQGYQGLVDELRLDVSRLGKRNLGRDDRAMSHWGREIRFPFLDEDLVRWAIGVPAWQKCDFGQPDGHVEPAKRVLRLLALEFGMMGVATEKKRAIQFGSRTAKMESGKVKGTTLLS